MTEQQQPRTTGQAASQASTTGQAADSPEAILAAVGDDPTKAAEALAAENAKEKPRQKLQARLFEIAEPGLQGADTSGDEAVDQAAKPVGVTYVNTKTKREVTFPRRQRNLEKSPVWKLKDDADDSDPGA